MVVQTFEIAFDRPSKTFFSGEKISGRIVVKVDKPENIEVLGLRLWGKATVSWQDKNSKTGRSKMSQNGLSDEEKPPANNEHLISEEETYFDRRVTVLEKTGPENILIPSGTNTYPFEISLPAGIPSSFQGEHGKVNYYLEALMKRSGGQDVEDKSPLVVKGILDLNNSHDAQVDRPEVAAEKHLCCFCCKNGPIGFHFRILGKSGMISGEKIPFSAEAYNMSYAGAVCLTLRFVQTITYSTKEKSNIVKKELFKMKGPSISRGGTGLWNNDNIDLPQDLPPTKLAGRSQIINVEYNFDVVLEIPRVSNLSAQIPVVVGTIPMGSSVDAIVAEENIK